MKNIFGRFFGTLPPASRVLLLLYALGFPVAMAGNYSHKFELYDWLGLVPSAVLHGEVWRVLTYAFLANGVVDYAVSLFWLITLVCVLGRNWRPREVWGFALLTTVAGAVCVLALKPGLYYPLAGNGAMIFGFLAAWYRLYGGERLILLGMGEISVREATLIVGFIEVLVSAFCLGPVVTGAMMGGGAVGWLYLVVRGRSVMNRRGQVVDSERIARLEL